MLSWDRFEQHHQSVNLLDSELPEAACVDPPQAINKALPGIIGIRAVAGDDYFYMPGVREIRRLPRLWWPCQGDFTLWTMVDVQGTRAFDAGGLLVGWGDDSLVKYALERNLQKQWQHIVVRSDPYSDESAGRLSVLGKSELLVTRQGDRLGFFSRGPKGDWLFDRVIWSALPNDLRIGLFAQAPFSPQVVARFSQLRWLNDGLPDRR